MAEQARLADRLRQLEQDMDEFVESDPELAKLWVQRHPAHLQMMAGWTVEGFHMEAFEDVLRYQTTMWLAPRGSGKSTSDGVFYPAWRALSWPENMREDIRETVFADAAREITPATIRVALSSNSQDRAIGMHRQVQAVLTHRRIVKLFGDLVGKQWKDASSTTRYRDESGTAQFREGTFSCLGLGSKIAGGHYDLFVADDWVTEDNARTELQRMRLHDFWGFTVRGTLEPWAQTLVCGTRYHPADWYKTVADWVGRGLWGHYRRTPALVETPDGLESYWPEVYPVETLLAIREQIGEVAFATQYQNDTDLMLGDFFSKEDVEAFARWNALRPEERNNAPTVIALDPAIKGGKRADYSVFCVVSYVKPNFYVRRIVRGQWTEDQLLERIRQLAHEYSPNVVGVEVVGGIEWLLDRAKREGVGARLRPLRPQQFRGKDKVGRASHVRSFFNQGRVLIEDPGQNPAAGTQRLVYEMMAFPNASEQAGMDDCVDALVWALILMSRGGTSRRRSRT